MTQLEKQIQASEKRIAKFEKNILMYEQRTDKKITTLNKKGIELSREDFQVVKTPDWKYSYTVEVSDRAKKLLSFTEWASIADNMERARENTDRLANERKELAALMEKQHSKQEITDKNQTLDDTLGNQLKLLMKDFRLEWMQTMQSRHQEFYARIHRMLPNAQKMYKATSNKLEELYSIYGRHHRSEQIKQLEESRQSFGRILSAPPARYDNIQDYMTMVHQQLVEEFDQHLQLLAQRCRDYHLDVTNLMIHQPTMSERGFDVVITDGKERLLDARIIWAAEESELVTPHTRYIVTERTTPDALKLHATGYSKKETAETSKSVPYQTSMNHNPQSEITMKTNPVIYTNEDVRPDLLTAEERSRFPEELTNEHRQQILEMTRLRIDSVDLNGNPIPTAAEWLDLYFGPEKLSDEERINAWTEGAIRSEVVIPDNGIVMPVDRGIADIAQRLLDSGLVINLETSRSGMITDNPHLRWIHEESNPNISGKPGEFIYDSPGEVGMKIHFPINETHKFYNDAQAINVITKAAKEAGLIASTQDKGGKMGKCIELTLPYLMDGTSFYECLEQTKAETSKSFEGRGVRDGWADAFRLNKAVVAANHGGYARFTDNMIQDRLARFERAVQRLVMQYPEMNRKTSTSLRYDDFLTGEQQDALRKQTFNYHKNLWAERALPHCYSRYKESPDKVDEVARLAGYHSYKDYIQKRSVPGDNDELKRRTEFQKLENKNLHTHQQGILKLFRINNGIAKESHVWQAEESRKLTEEVINKYRRCGYPVNRLSGISISMDNEGKATMYARIDNKYLARPIAPDDMARLLSHATTPFEIGINTFASELGWKNKLNMNISPKTAEQLQLTEVQMGKYILSQGEQVFKVDEQTYNHAYMLTRLEQMPKTLRQAFSQEQPPLDDSAMLDFETLQKRFDKFIKHINESVSDIKVLRVNDNKFSMSCKINGNTVPSVEMTMDDLDFKERFLPGMNKEELTKEQIASKYGNRLFNSESNTRGFKL